MRRALPVLCAIALGVLLVWWLRDRRSEREIEPPHSLPPVADRESARVPVPDAAAPDSAPHAQEPLTLAVAVPVAGSRTGGDLRTARAYRLVLNGGECTLEAVEEIRGDFRRPRAMAWLAGMLCCRLLDSAGNLLAEETMQAPDYHCVVLDPLTPGQDGEPTPAVFTPSGPMTFQTRLPAIAGAARLEVIRLAGGPAASAGSRPPGRVLASIALDNP